MSFFDDYSYNTQGSDIPPKDTENTAYPVAQEQDLAPVEAPTEESFTPDSSTNFTQHPEQPQTGEPAAPKEETIPSWRTSYTPSNTQAPAQPKTEEPAAPKEEAIPSWRTNYNPSNTQAPAQPQNEEPAAPKEETVPSWRTNYNPSITQAPAQQPASQPEIPPANGWRVAPQPQQQPQQPAQRPYQPYQPYQSGYNPPYTPNPGYQPAPYTPAQNPNPYRPAPNYQYSPNSGWQQPMQQTPPPQTIEKPAAQWELQDYEKAAASTTKNKKSRGMVIFVVSLIGVLLVCLIGLSVYGIYNYVNDNPEAMVNEFSEAGKSTVESSLQMDIAQKPQITESLPVGGKMTTVQIAKAVSPSVVGVMQYQPDMYLEETGMGSGIIMSEDGYIITNAHVVAGGTAFKVILADGTPKDADLIGSDPRTDLAVLKARNVTGLTPATFGDSDELEVGEVVVAIGNPAGMELAGSVTQGIISAVNREIPTSTYRMTYIQTDAAINPGNSGGALVNEYGQVIGINSSKIVAEGFEGISFAIPISIAKPVIDDLMINGRVTGRVVLGITGRVIDEIDARQAGLTMGIRIDEITPNSDLATKDIQRFDIITHIDGERIYDLDDLRDILDKHKPGDQVTLSIYRPVGMTESRTFDITVTLLEDK